MPGAVEIYSFPVTFAIGSTPAAPVTINVPIPPRKLVGIEADVPDGWNGVVGFALASGGQQVIPVNRGNWIIASGDVLHWNLDGLPDSGAWQVIGYNTGTYPHTLYLRFLAALVDQAQTAQNATIASLDGLSSAVSLG